MNKFFKMISVFSFFTISIFSIAFEDDGYFSRSSFSEFEEALLNIPTLKKNKSGIYQCPYCLSFKNPSESKTISHIELYHQDKILVSKKMSKSSKTTKEPGKKPVTIENGSYNDNSLKRKRADNTTSKRSKFAKHNTDNFDDDLIDLSDDDDSNID